MIAIIYVAKNNQREFVPSPPAPPLLSEGTTKNIIRFFFVEVIKHCIVNRSFHCLIVLIVMITLPCATFLRPYGSSFNICCSTKGSHLPGDGGLGGGTPYNGLHGEAPPERDIFFRLVVYKRVGISRAKV